MADHAGKAVWNGDQKGSGTLTTQSGALNAPYSVGSRFEGKPGTNPEELVGAAHAGCYTMYLAIQLSKAGATVEQLNTESKVTMDTVDGKPKITKIHVTTEGQVSGISAEDFQKHAEDAKLNCPISQLLQAVPEMKLTASLK